jgi:hypothetical protein
MYPVSQEFLNAMKAEKYRVLARVAVDYTDPFMDQSIDIAANEQANVSHPAQTADSVTEPFGKFASLDGSWVLDGAYTLAPATPEEAQNKQMGWWGSQLSGIDGAFVLPYPALTVTHFPRPVHSLSVTGDSKRMEHPVDFQVNLYAEDGTLLHTKNVTGNTEVAWRYTLPNPVLDVAKQVLTITRWSHAGRQAKILEFFTSIQETYLADDLVSLHLLEEREASQGSLPVGNITANEITLSFNNESRKFDVDNTQSPLWGLLKQNRRVRAWLGVDIDGLTEWVPLGVFWTLDWDNLDETLEATVTARDRMELLRQGTYQSSQVQANVSLYTLAEHVLQDAGLTTSDYAIDSALQNIIVPYAWFDPVSHREALRIIAEAALAAVYADRDGTICITPFALGGDTPVLTITEDDYFSPPRAPSRQESVANEVIVTTQPLRPVVAPEEVYRSNEPISVPANQTVSITVHFNQPPVIEAEASLISPPAGVSISSVTYYGWGAQVGIKNVNASAAQVTLSIEGKPLTVQNKERATARDEASITENGPLRFEFPENSLVQTLTQAQNIANTLLPSVKDPRRDIALDDWRGNPALLLGDRVTVKGQDYHVIRQEVEWSGGLEAKLSGRRAM